MKSLTHLPADALTARLYEIRKEERALLIEFLDYLAELDRRKTVLELGYSSLFVFCTDYLGLTKATAYRRTTSAYLLARFPIIAEYLADGRLNTTTLVELRSVLEEKGLVEILDRAAGRTEEQVKELVAALRPQPAPADLLRRLPVRQLDESGFRTKPIEELPGVSASPALVTAPVVTTPPAPEPVRAAGRVQQIAPAQHVLRVTVGSEFVADLEAVKQALSHKLPAGGLEEVLHECLRVTLEACQRRRRGAGRKDTAKAPPTGSRYIPAAVRETVWSRDGGQCTFLGTAGHRCTSKRRLEFHHIQPFAKGGLTTTENLTLRCRAHNAYAAEQDYGSEHIARKIARTTSRAGDIIESWT